MASRNISIRLALENQQQVTRGLDQVGTQGQAALKKVSDASAPASKGLLALNDASRSVRGEMESLTGRLGPLGSALSALGIGGVAAGAALAGLGVGLKAALAAAAEAEKVELRLGAVLKATGNAAGLTKAQLIDYANSLQGSLKINDETLKESIAVLSTFRAVSGDTFKTGIKLAADLSAVFGGDLLSSTRQIGLAFQDPAAGMTALRRAGVTFTETQKDMIKSLQESGDLLGAQGIIVAELTQQVGGAAQAEGGGLAGATRGLANEWDDLLEAIGRTEAVMGPALFIVEKISSAIRGLASLSPTIDQKIVDLNKQVLAEDNNIARLTRGGVSGVAIKPHQDRKLALEQELDALIKIARAESDAEGAAQSRAQVAAIASRAGIALEASAQKLKKEGEEAAKEAAAAAKKAEADRIAGLKEEADWLFRITDLIEKDVKAWEKKNAQLPEYIAGLEQQQRLAGLTAEAREEELAVIKAAELAVHGLSEADEARIRSIVRATNAQEAGIEAAKKAAEESARAWEKATDRLKDSITDSIFRGFEEGESAGKLFFDTLRRAALTAAIQIPVNFLVDQGAGLLQGALGGGGGGSGALGTAANGARLANFFSGGSLTAGISAKLFGTAGVAATTNLATGAATAGTAATSGLLGSGGFAASGLATALPYIGAGVAALGILKGLGVIGGGRSVGPNAGAQLIEQGGVFAVGPSGADNGGNTAGVIAEVSQAVEVLNALAQGIGVAQIGDGIASFIDTFKAGGIGNAADLIKDAISKGVIEGLTEAERALISSSSDVSATAARIIENRLLPGQLASQRLQIEDPAKFARDAAMAERDGMILRLAEIENGAQALADVEFIYQRKLSDIQKQFATDAGAAIGDALSQAAEVARLRLTAANDNLGRASSVLAKAVAAERDTVTKRFNEGLKASQKALDDLTVSANRIKSIAGSLKSALGGMDIAGNEGFARQAAQAQLQGFLSAARNGGALPDQDVLEAALRDLQRPSEALFNTFVDYQRDFVTTRNDISELADRAGWQAAKVDAQTDIVRQQIEQDRTAYDNEIARLDGILTSAQAQIDAANGTTIAVMSVEQAIRELGIAAARAQTAGGAARSAEAKASPVNSLYQTLLGRGADTAGAAHFSAALASGQSTVDVAQNIIRSSEFASVNRTIDDLYTNILGRAPDAEGLAYWQGQLAAGQSLQEIALNFTRGQEYADLVAVRGYASGGMHPGGLRIVGERGPELEWTPPSRIYSNSQSMAMLDNSAVVAELREVKSRLDRVDAALISIADKTATQEKLQRKWDTTGLLTRTA